MFQQKIFPLASTNGPLKNVHWPSPNDELQALLFLSSLPDNYENLVVSLNNSTPNDVLQLATVKDSLFNEESRRKDMGKDNAQALVTKNMSKSKSRHFKEHGKSKSQS